MKSFTRLYEVLLGFTGCYWVLLGFTSFHCFFLLIRGLSGIGLGFTTRSTGSDWIWFIFLSVLTSCTELKRLWPSRVGERNERDRFDGVVPSFFFVSLWLVFPWNVWGMGRRLFIERAGMVGRNNNSTPLPFLSGHRGVNGRQASYWNHHHKS